MADVHTACVTCQNTNSRCDHCHEGCRQRYTATHRGNAFVAFFQLPVLARSVALFEERMAKIDLQDVQLFAWLKLRHSRGNFEFAMTMQGYFVDLPRAHMFHILHMFQMLKIVRHVEPELKTLARQTMFKLVLSGQYEFEDQELMVLAVSMCTLVQNLVTVI
jgi:hypothetical protein